MWLRGTFPAWLPQSVPTFKLTHPTQERGSCAVDPHRFTNEPVILNSVLDKERVFVNLIVCSSPVTTVWSIGASMSCISQQLLKRLPVSFQHQLQPTHCRLFAAESLITCLGHIKFVGITRWQPIWAIILDVEVLRSWLSSWFRLPWRQSLGCFFL